MTHWRKRLVDLAGVTAITVIVWLWASGQTLQRRIIALDVAIESGEPARTVVTAPDSVHVAIEISGSRQAVIRASESLSGRTVQILTGAGGVPAEVGEHDIFMKDALEVSPAFTSFGVEVTTVTPPVVRVSVRPMREPS